MASHRAKGAFSCRRSRRDHAIDFRSTVSDPFQHGAGVLTKARRRQPVLTHAAMKCVCYLGAAYRPFARVLLAFEEANVGQMWIGEQVIDRVERAAGTSSASKVSSHSAVVRCANPVARTSK